MSDTRKTTKPNVPNLRFPGFSGEWASRRIGEDCTVNMCKRIFANQTSEQGDVPFFKIGTIGGTPDAYITRDLFEEYKAKYNYPHEGEVMITCAGTVGKTIVFDGEDAYFQDSNIVWLSNPKQLYINSFLNYVLSRVNWNILNSTTITRIYNDNLRELVINYPSIKEQEKIVALLSLLDLRIAIQNKVIEDLKKLKSAFCEKMYDESNPNTRLADIIEQQSIRNKAGEDLKVLSVSNRYGFVEQSEQFEDRTIASEDTSNYKIVALNDFAYNPARINVGSIARLKNFENGIVSPMYICFRCKGSVLPEFLEPFFSTKYFSLEMGKRLEGSVRMCLSFEGLCNIPINIPSYEEQTETAKKVNALSEKLRLEESYSILLSAQKEYILSQMFI